MDPNKKRIFRIKRRSSECLIRLLHAEITIVWLPIYERIGNNSIRMFSVHINIGVWHMHTHSEHVCRKLKIYASEITLIVIRNTFRQHIACDDFWLVTKEKTNFIEIHFKLRTNNNNLIGQICTYRNVQIEYHSQFKPVKILHWTIPFVSRNERTRARVSYQIYYSFHLWHLSLHAELEQRGKTSFIIQYSLSIYRQTVYFLRKHSHTTCRMSSHTCQVPLWDRMS